MILVPHILAGGSGIVTGVLTFYLVLTAVLTVRRSAAWLDFGATLVGVARSHQTDLSRHRWRRSPRGRMK
jgi:hypothetical protein